MPTKRRKLAPRSIGIPPAAIEAWKSGDMRAVNHLLGRKPWEVGVDDATCDTPPDWGRDTPWAGSWAKARELHLELLRLAGRPGKSDRHGRPAGSAPDTRKFWE